MYNCELDKLSMMIPSVYDDSLSYYEVISKICAVLKDIVPKVTDIQGNIVNIVREELTKLGLENIVHDVIVELLRDTNPVNVALLGFDPTGQRDNLALFNEFTNDFALQFNKGVYLFSDTVVPHNDIYGYGDGCSSGNSQDTIFRYSNITYCAVDARDSKCKNIKGITVDIRNWNVHGFVFRHSEFLNCTCEYNKVYGLGGGHYGFMFSPQYSTNKYMFVNHCSVQGYSLLGGSLVNGSVGYYVASTAPDCLIVNSNAQACQKGIECHAGVEADNIHLWGASTNTDGLANWWAQTVGVDAYDTLVNLGHIYIDSYAVGVRANNTYVVIDSMFALTDGYVTNNTQTSTDFKHFHADSRSSIIVSTANLDLKRCRPYEAGQNIRIDNQFTCYLGWVADTGVTYETSYTKDIYYFVDRTSGDTCIASGYMRYGAVMDLEVAFDGGVTNVHLVNTSQAYVSKDSEALGMKFTVHTNGEFRLYVDSGAENKRFRIKASGGTNNAFIINPMMLGNEPREYFYRGIRSGESAVRV